MSREVPRHRQHSPTTPPTFAQSASPYLPHTPSSTQRSPLPPSVSEISPSGWQIWEPSPHRILSSAPPSPVKGSYPNAGRAPQPSNVSPRQVSQTGRPDESHHYIPSFGHTLSVGAPPQVPASYQTQRYQGVGIGPPPSSTWPPFEDEFTKAIQAVTLGDSRSPAHPPAPVSLPTISPTVFTFPSIDHPIAYYPSGPEPSFSPYPGEPTFYPLPGLYPPGPPLPPGQPQPPAVYYDFGQGRIPPFAGSYMYHPSSGFPPPGPSLVPPSGHQQYYQPSGFQSNRPLTRFRHTPRSASDSLGPRHLQPRARALTFSTSSGHPNDFRVPVSPSLGRGENPRRGSHGQLPPHPPRPRAPSMPKSEIVARFRDSRAHQNWSLSDVFGHLHDFASDQYGSRFIQEQLTEASEEEIKEIHAELSVKSLLTLMLDVFGNYVVQKLFDFGTQSQRSGLVAAMKNHVLELALDTYGCRVLQKAIECATPDEHSLLVEEISSDAMTCVTDTNGNHVIQRLLQFVQPTRLTFLPDFREGILILATHPYGCRVLQRCLEYLPEEETSLFVDGLQKECESLVENQFGNYVIQFVLTSHGSSARDRSRIVQAMCPNFLRLARHKYASNVCEKALLAANTDDKQLIIDELLKEGDKGFPMIGLLMRDQYGNYVVQTAMDVVGGEQRERLMHTIYAVAQRLLRSRAASGKNLAALERLLDKAGHYLTYRMPGMQYQQSS